MTQEGRELLALMGTLRAEMTDSHRGAELHDSIAILAIEVKAGRLAVEEALNAASVRAEDLRKVTERRAISAEDWRYNNGYHRAIDDMRRAAALSTPEGRSK
jgi:hypothetical protein